MAHAPAAVSRSGDRAVCAAVDAPACDEGLLGDGQAARGISRVYATFNMVPSLGVQLEEYASGKFDEPWFDAGVQDGGKADAGR